MFSCELFETFDNRYFTETLQAAASGVIICCNRILWTRVLATVNVLQQALRKEFCKNQNLRNSK